MKHPAVWQGVLSSLEPIGARRRFPLALAPAVYSPGNVATLWRRLEEPVQPNQRQGGMQLVVAIVQDEDARFATEALTKAGVRVTRIDTVGGFLRRGNATLLMGVERAAVPQIMHLLQEHCKTRTGYAVPALLEGMAGIAGGQPLEVQVGGATVLVMDVARFERM